MEREKIELPIAFIPNAESFKKLGFELDLNYKNKNFCNAQLPEGWHEFRNEKDGSKYILDEDFSIRAIINTRFGFDGRKGSVRLLCRYQITTYEIDKDKEEYMVSLVDTKTNEILYSEHYSTLEADKLFGKFIIEDLNTKKIVRFAQEHYPDYMDPTCYWDDKKKNKKLVKEIQTHL
jgi:hypothetical protein